MQEENRVYQARSGYVLRDLMGESLLIPVGPPGETPPNMAILSPVAGFLWQQLQQGRSFSQLLDAVMAEFEVDEPTAAADIQEFLEQMVRDQYVTIDGGNT